MDGFLVFMGYAAIMFLVCMLGSYLPQIKKLNDAQRHMLIALSAGIFLALIFCLFLPEAYELCIEEAGMEFGNMSYMLLAGFLVIAFIDVMIRHYHMRACPCECHRDEHKHELMSLTTFIGLSVHACCDGLALAAAVIGGETVGFIALCGMCLHKFVETFSLSSSFLLSDGNSKRKWTYLTAFSLITPVAGIVFYLFLNGLDIHNVAGLPMAFAAGTFMYVTFCDILPEAFHRKEMDLKTFVVIAAGVAIAVVCLALVEMTGGHI